MTEDLHAEIHRLRALLEDNGIDPDPEPPEPEQFGPPTEMVWRLQKMFARGTALAVTELIVRNQDAEFLSGMRWPSPLRIRPPTDFTTRSPGPTA